MVLIKTPLPLAMNDEFIAFPSRRSVVHSTEGMVACTQPLAAKCGLKILAQGGNAAVHPLPSLTPSTNEKSLFRMQQLQWVSLLFSLETMFERGYNLIDVQPLASISPSPAQQE